ncbi:serine/threonine protein kinase [Nocardiopsis sp. Huas11]|uniref:protein kinase domain-containing protein n=1 Tax=Nocardiopsis sp. Huas11 TaxID=2183912 RepID=UPI000EB3784B|nr:protein kinase [Nocardiopsis sp. Huas11]RKS09612.1 serine/threonine protein kinase [Nocardiopsis sp. Huas11]
MSLNLYVGPDTQPDKYRLVRSVGRGGEATLYLAEVSLAGQTEPVVVKVLNSDVTANEEQFAELSAKWGEQAELLRFINRLGVVGVREHFEGAPEHPAEGAGEYSDRALYLVMNYVEGLDLRDWRAEHTVEGVRGQREVLRFLEQVAQVLDVLHSGRATPSKRVVVHGDLSPGNIMVSDEGQATLVDFGLSRIAARHMTARPWFTPGYAAPEIFNGEYSAATDRYAFGAIAYYALTGEDPPPTPEQLRERFGALPLLAEAGERQRTLVMAMFSAEPGERPEASEWMRALRSLATSVPWTGPAAEPGAAVLAAAVTEGFEDGPGEPAGPDGPTDPAHGDGAEAPTVAENAAHSGAGRPDGPPPESLPVSSAAASAGAGEHSGPGDMPPRPVGGMRGATSQQAPPLQQTSPQGPAAGQAPPPGTGPGSGPGTGTGPQGTRAPAGPPHSGPHAARPSGPPPTGPYTGPQNSGPPGPGTRQQPSGHRPPSGPVPPGRPSGPYTGPQPTWSGPVHTTGAFAAPAAPPTGVTAPEKKRRSRKPMLIGFAVFGVLCLIAGGGLSYVVMDRVVPALTAGEGTEVAADTAVDEASEAPAGAGAVESDAPGEDPPEEGAATASPPADDDDGADDPASESATLLTQVEPVDEEGAWIPEVGRAEVDAEVYSRALVSGDNCGSDYNECVGWADYNLSRDYTSFTAVVGVDDTSSATGTVTFTVFAERESLISETVQLGETVELDVDVTDVLRLTLGVEASDSGLFPVWVDPTLNP